MSPPKPIIYEGCFGLRKPTSISSAQALRDLETHFNNSTLFRANLEAEREAVRQEKLTNPRFKRKRGPNRQHRVKLGHGGTLDPLATGVLVTGVGRGTKSLSQFLACTKTYECVVLFGCATDSYDSVGKVVGRAPHAHVTRDLVEAALAKFRGKTMQKPPVFSALRVNGKHMYEYAREGLDIPEIKDRPVEVSELELLEWIEPGTHEWRYPTEEVAQEEKAAADKLLQASLTEPAKDAQKDAPAEAEAESAELKRKRDGEDNADDSAADLVKDDPAAKKSKTETGSQAVMTGALPTDTETTTTTTTSDAPTTAEDGASAPAARIRMTVSSGFYVRSLCHDLGAAVNSLGVMTALDRTRQGDFSLGKNVLEYDDLAKGEEVWGPQVKAMLRAWMLREGWASERDFAGEEGGAGGAAGAAGEKTAREGTAERESERRPSPKAAGRNEMVFEVD
ncbi:uncharacterized protein K452DRAFT_353498 [Aplosporella prunicola CBS 121167]|uniref:tRNA pseudouridine(55) synthase n=1 Tax=Aplosporella prunicola CBS 121167 TaxID=1176127 RepID=A0A6A6B2M5_9PEZI|nr:uncharacterized protein K452DRAFT_353498 [Aplosporella prunicola CBS 121167]KAF2137505.1 hypothetical protein K452DRAFT_353498 [Aplosporella prunicola CBS 121167]